jgi:hypothetical protein
VLGSCILGGACGARQCLSFTRILLAGFGKFRTDERGTSKRAASMADVMTSTASDGILVKERDLACDPGADDLSVGKEWRMQGAK